MDNEIFEIFILFDHNLRNVLNAVTDYTEFNLEHKMKG